uniref:Tetraspanin-13 n=1 Tax=Caligus clemensi TaxID=344056 RepID=C1C1N4_CALCM|nr:Tetraspanin-13 [Caligus clemensi]
MSFRDGFSCSRSTLILLNAGYILAALILIIVGSSYGSISNTSVPIVSGILVCGVGLLMVAVLGLVGTVKNHQVMLFSYMCILAFIFLIQFSAACATLGVGPETEKAFIQKAWNHLDSDSKLALEKNLGCCGYESHAGLNCTSISPCGTVYEFPACPTCLDVIEPLLNAAFNSVGWSGLIIAFVELIGIYSTYKYRIHIRNMSELP